MSSYYIPECTPVAPVCNPCPVIEEGRVRGFGLMTQEFYETNPNFQVYSTWVNAIDNGQLFWFPFCNGSLDITPKMSDGYGSRPQQVDAFTFDMKLAFPEVLTNIPFWNSVQNINNLVGLYISQTQLWVASSNAMIIPTVPVTSDITGKVDIKVNVQFIQGLNIIPQTLIPGIADTCIDA